MKKIVFVSIILAQCLSSYAQFVNSANVNTLATKNSEVSFQVGFNSSRMSMYDSKSGFNFGVNFVTYQPSWYEGAYYSISALFTQKGCSLDFGDWGNGSITLNYIEIPVHIGGMIPLNEKFSLFGDIGPYVSYGISGTGKATDYDYDYYDDVRYSTITYDPFERNDDDEDEGYFKRFDAGFGLRVGVKTSHLIFSISYEKGLVGTYKNEFEDDDYYGDDLTSKCKNTSLSFSVGYIF